MTETVYEPTITETLVSALPTHSTSCKKSSSPGIVNESMSTATVETNVAPPSSSSVQTSTPSLQPSYILVTIVSAELFSPASAVQSTSYASSLSTPPPLPTLPAVDNWQCEWPDSDQVYPEYGNPLDCWASFIADESTSTPTSTGQSSTIAPAMTLSASGSDGYLTDITSWDYDVTPEGSSTECTDSLTYSTAHAYYPWGYGPSPVVPESTSAVAFASQLPTTVSPPDFYGYFTDENPWPTSLTSVETLSESTASSTSYTAFSYDNLWGYSPASMVPESTSTEVSGVTYLITTVLVSPSPEPTSSNRSTPWSDSSYIFGPPSSTPTNTMADPGFTPVSLDLSFGVTSSYFNQQFTGQNSSIICTSCTGSGSLNFTDSNLFYDPSEAPTSFETISQNGIMTLTVAETLIAHIELNASIGKEADVVLLLRDSTPLPFFVDPGTGSIGFSPQVVIESNLTAPLNLSTGFHVEVPANSSIMFTLGQANGSRVTGFNNTRVTALPLTVYGAAEGSVNISFVPQIPITWQFYEGAVEVELDVSTHLPMLQLNFSKQNSSDPSCLLDGKNQTTMYSSNLIFDVGFDAIGSTDLGAALLQRDEIDVNVDDLVRGPEGITAWNASMAIFSSTRALASHCMPTPATASAISSISSSASVSSSTRTPTSSQTALSDVVNLSSRPNSEGNIITHGCGLALGAIALWFAFFV